MNDAPLTPQAKPTFVQDASAQEASSLLDAKKSQRRFRMITLGGMLSVILLFSALLIYLSLCDHPYQYSPNTKILLYHLVCDEVYGPNDYLFVRESDFEAQLIEIEQRGYKTVFADELHKTKGEKCVAITFDDGYLDNYTNVLPLLKKHNAKATVFLISDMIGKEGHLNEAQIREMQKSGHFHFGSHTKTHQNLSVLSQNEIEEEFLRSKEVIESITGKKITAIAYPNGVSSPTAHRVAENLGYRYAFTTDAPSEAFYENTRLPRYYILRDMTAEAFSQLLP